MEVTLCPTCAVEHATDNVRVECSKRGFVQPQTKCPQYKPTREKRLEDALRELFDALEEPKVSITSVHKPSADRVLVALLNTKELLGK